jgi:hypothetical protein
MDSQCPSAKREQFTLDLDEIARRGARRMLAEALEAEVQTYIEAARPDVVRYKRALKPKLDEGGVSTAYKSSARPAQTVCRSEPPTRL